MRDDRSPLRAWPWFMGAAAVYSGTLIGTWWPGVGHTDVNLVPFRTHMRDIRRGLRAPEARAAWRDLGINAGLLMPASALLAQGFCRTGRTHSAVVATLVLGGLGSLVIEIGQVVIPGRVPDATDVVLNTVGAGLSGGVVAWWATRDERPGPLRRR